MESGGGDTEGGVQFSQDGQGGCGEEVGEDSGSHGNRFAVRCSDSHFC